MDKGGQKNEDSTDLDELRQNADINSAKLSLVMRKNRDYIEEIKQLKSANQAQKTKNEAKFDETKQKLNGTKAKLHKVKSNYKFISDVAVKQQKVQNFLTSQK